MNDALYHNTEDTATRTGLSQRYLRDRAKKGEIPHIRVGTKFMFNIPALMEQLKTESEESIRRAEQ